MKKIVVFGASGQTGSLIVQQALEAGHQVTATMRRPQTWTLQHPQLTVLQSDMYDLPSVERALVGQEVVISAVASPTNRQPTEIQAYTTRTLLNMMAALGLKRFLGITSGGTNPEHDPNLPFMFQYVFKPLFHNIYDDQKKAEEILAASQADWTLARPAQLTDEPCTGQYRLANAYSLTNGRSIARADVADFLVKQIESSTYNRQAVAIAY